MSDVELFSSEPLEDGEIYFHLDEDKKNGETWPCWVVHVGSIVGVAVETEEGSYAWSVFLDDGSPHPWAQLTSQGSCSSLPLALSSMCSAAFACAAEI